jgi:hypothetical protein
MELLICISYVELLIWYFLCGITYAILLEMPGLYCAARLPPETGASNTASGKKPGKQFVAAVRASDARAALHPRIMIDLP